MLLVTSCATRQATKDFTQAEAGAITSKCKAPKQWLTVVQGEALMRPDEGGDYNASECVLKALMATGKTKIGIVGNEAFAPVDSK